MAVSFKVPSSPARSIFEIDEFLGVDLTNSGTNVEEHRSPNAENMVRLVPGKVRKRTGYKDNILFHDLVNLNRAKQTSDEYVRYELEEDVVLPLYELADVFKAHTPYTMKCLINTDGKLRIGLGKEDGTLGSAGTINEGGEDILFTRKVLETDYDHYTVSVMSQGATYIEIKGVFVTHKRRGEAEDLVWSEAPEDRGARVVEVDAIQPIYGCHTLRLPKKGGNFALNLNRVKNAYSQFKTLANNDIVCDLVDFLPYKQIVYLDFDYISNSDFTIKFEGKVFANVSASVEEKHFSIKSELPNNGSRFRLETLGANIQLKNISVVYDKDENYTWSQAPEDFGKSVEARWFYDVDESTDYTWDRNFHSDGTASNISVEYPIDLTQPNFYPTDKPMRIDLEISTDSGVGAELSSLQLGYKITYNDSSTTGSFIPILESDYNLSGEHVSLYIDPRYPSLGSNQSVRKLYMIFTFKTKPTNQSVKISWANLTVNTFEMKENYFIPSVIKYYHVGTKMYMDKCDGSVPTLVYSNMNSQKSMAWQFSAYTEGVQGEGVVKRDWDNLYVVDGKTYLCCDGNTNAVYPMYGNGRIPTTTIAKNPNGTAGQSYDAVNMLQPGFEETFIGDGTSKALHLGFLPLDRDKSVRVWVRDPITPTTWLELKEGTSFTVNYDEGIINTVSSTPEPMISGEPNIRVRAFKTFQDYKDRVNKCAFGTLFGVNGEPNRIFLSGNPDYKNSDFWSEMNEPGYFPDKNYSRLGTDNSAVVGYAIVNNYLAAFKDEYERAQNVIIREGDLFTDENTHIADGSFKTINSLQGSGAVSAFAFGYLQTEPLFLTRTGIHAITAQDITGEKYSQNRSFFLNGQLTKEPNLENAYAVVYNDMYVLALNGKLYILDGLQPIRTDKSEPYATRQYVGFYCTNIPAICMWTDEQALWFGTEDGRVCKFATDIEDLESYNDNGKEIYCCWETPDLDGKLFYKNKSFRYIAIRMMAALKTSAKLYSMARGAWNFIKEDKSSGIFFDFENLDFDAFSFSTDRSDKVAHSKIRVKKVDKARFKIENDKLNEPFGLMNLALEYVESGNYKG